MNLPAADAARSGLYACEVLHERHSPRRHRFSYGIFLLALDLDELPGLDRSLMGFSVNRPNLLSLREADYLPSGAAPTLRKRVEIWCAEQGVPLGPDPRITLVTLPRMFGYGFNPVSFYFCHRRDGTPLCAIAEVGNTFGEIKPYLVPANADPADPDRVVFRRRVPKHFYVSPFSSVDVAFDFTLHLPGPHLAVRIDDYDGDRRTLHSVLTGVRHPLTSARLAWCLVRYPLLTVRVITLIHWHALRLWLARVPHFPKAADADRQRGLFRPHASLTRSGPAPATPLPRP